MKCIIGEPRESSPTGERRSWKKGSSRTGGIIASSPSWSRGQETRTASRDGVADVRETGSVIGRVIWEFNSLGGL